MARALRILICDDNPDSAATLGALMKVSGYEIFACTDAETCLERARSWRPHVALLDIGVPRKNGYQIAEEIRAMDFGDDILLVAITGYGTSADIGRAHDAGFDVHLVKPAALERLLKLIGDRKTDRP